MVQFGKKAIRELYYDVAKEVISIEFELNPTLIIPLPHDYVRYVRVSAVSPNGRLNPLALDNSNNLAQAYLQDNNYNYLYDSQGDILEGTHIQNTPATNQKLGILDDTLDIYGPNALNRGYYAAWNGTPDFNLNLSKIYQNGSFRINKEEGVMQFNSQADGSIIVLEYISDGLFQRDDSAIKIHKFAEEAVYNFIYWSLIKNRRSVSDNKIERARREWYNMRRVAKRRITPVNYEDIRQILKGSSKFIKD